MTRLLNTDDYGIQTLEDDPELILMLDADILLESKDQESFKIARQYGKTFLVRP